MSQKLDEKIVQDEVSRLDSFYKELQEGVEVTRLQNKERWVTPQETKMRPIHRWYALKESFDPEFVAWVFEISKERLGVKKLRVLDPYAGAGTTGVVGKELGHDVDQIEYNPFIRLAARVKVAASDLQPKNLGSALALPEWRNLPSTKLPTLSTLNEPKYFDVDDVQNLVNVREWIKNNFTYPEQDALLLGIAWTAQEIANLRKDGRALRYTQKARKNIRDVLLGKWREILEDATAVQSGQIPQVGRSRVLGGTSICFRDLTDQHDRSHDLDDHSFDLVFYSPPYLNNFDYSEVYKIELWILGLLSDDEAWRELRRGTIRSHPSLKFSRKAMPDWDERSAKVFTFLDLLGQSEALSRETKKDMADIFTGYFEDMYLSLREQFRVLMPGGLLAFNVANSRHKMLPIATDVLLLELARGVGFEMPELYELRHRNGRTKSKAFLRESLVVMKKP